MEKVFCKHHPKCLCILKTGTTPGKKYFKENFYMCSNLRGGCKFVFHSTKQIPTMVCEKHGELVSLRKWLTNKRVKYYCCKKEGSNWCGDYDVEVNKENDLLETCLDVVKGSNSQVPINNSNLSGEKKEARDLSHLGRGNRCSADSDIDDETCLDVVKGSNSQVPINNSNLSGEKKEARDLSHLGRGNGCGTDSDIDDKSVGNVDSDNDKAISEGGDFGCSEEEKTSYESDAGSVYCLDNYGYNDGSGKYMGESQLSRGGCCQLESSEKYGSPDQEEGEMSKDNVSGVASLCASLESCSKANPDAVCESEDTLVWAARDDATNSDKSDVNESTFQDRTDSEDSVSSDDELPSLQQRILFQIGTSHQRQRGVEDQNSTLIIEGESPSLLPVPSSLIPQHSAAATECHPTVERKEDEEETDQGKPEATFKVGFQSRKVIQQIGEIESLLRNIGHKLPDGGADLRRKRDLLSARLNQIKKPTDPATMQRLISASTNKKGLALQSRMMTANVVEQLHKSLKDCPSGEEMVEDPAGLKVTLMIHQKKALAWMLWKEKQIPSGGILADDMGLGKTLSMLSLVAANLNPRSDPGHAKWLSAPPAKSGLLRCTGTLVVCPASLLRQWEEEVMSKFREGTMKTLVYHGPRRIRDPQDLLHYDVVITTYNIVSLEACTTDTEMKKKKTSPFSTLFGVHWRRVILDEAHVIRNPKSGLSMGVCLLTADSHWGVTGTPIHNKLKDLYSLVKFLQLAPFDDPVTWRQTVEKRGSVGMRRINTMVTSLMLRRTKEEIQDQIHLTQKFVETHVITLRQEEKDIYDVLFKKAQIVMYKWLEEQGEFHSKKDTGVGSEENGEGVDSLSTLPPMVSRILSSILEPYLVKSGGRFVLGLLLRLRQCCCHLKLMTSAMLSAESDLGHLDLELAMGGLTLEEGDRGGIDMDGSRVGNMTLPQVFTKEKSSTKIREVIAELNRIASTQEFPPQKSVIVSQWTSMLDICAFHLDRTGISHTRIDGSVKPRDRQHRMNSFNSPDRNPTVMLLSLLAGGVGLNLIGGNHVFMLDMHWNPALEMQAADRCHRVGQNRDVHIHKFVCSGTVEERILQLQTKKLELAKNVLDGASTKMRKDKNKLSLNELKSLYGIV